MTLGGTIRGGGRRAWSDGQAFFLGTCGKAVARGLPCALLQASFNDDAEPSRKERGQRGVRPRHPRRKAFGPDGVGSSSGLEPRHFLWPLRAFPLAVQTGSGLPATLLEQDTPGDDRLRRGRLVGVVASRGPGRPRKTPGKTISADSHEYALAA